MQKQQPLTVLSKEAAAMRQHPELHTNLLARIFPNGSIRRRRLLEVYRRFQKTVLTPTDSESNDSTQPAAGLYPFVEGLWHTVPDDHPATAGGSNRRLLFVDWLVPDPMFGGGQPRAYTILEGLAHSGCRVTFFPMKHRKGGTSIYEYFTSLGVELFAGLWENEELCFEALLRRRKREYDCVLVSRAPLMAVVHRMIRKWQPRAQLVYDAEAIAAQRTVLWHELVTGQKMAAVRRRSMLQYEIQLAFQADTVLTVSEREKEIFEDSGVKSVHLLSHQIKAEPTPAAFSARQDILFVGSMRGAPNPNLDSMVFFVGEVFPALRETLGINLHIVGSADRESMDRLRVPGVMLYGSVADLSPWYNQSRIFVAPTRFAAGIPFKVGEAAARGLPCVASKLLAEQLGWVPEKELLAAGTADQFIQQCTRLYTDERLWTSVRTAAIKRVEQEYSTERFRKALFRAIIDDSSTEEVRPCDS